MMHQKTFGTAATLSSLLLLLTGCAPSYRSAPPEILMAPVAIPQPPAGEVTWWDVYDLAVRRGDALLQCNGARLGPLSAWALPRD